MAMSDAPMSRGPRVDLIVRERGQSGWPPPTYRPSEFSSEYFRSTCAIASPTPVFHTTVPSSWTFGVGAMSLMPRHCSIISSIGVPRRR